MKRIVVAAVAFFAASVAHASPPYLIPYKPAAGAFVHWTAEIDLQVDARIAEFKSDKNLEGNAWAITASCPALGVAADNVALGPWGGAGNPWHKKVPVPAITAPLHVTCTVTLKGGLPSPKSWSTQYSFQVDPPGPADLSVAPEPDAPSEWPQHFKVTNVGHSPSEVTLLRVKVDVLDGDVDTVKRSCRPKFTDFDDAVPGLTPAGSAASAVTINPPPPNPVKIRYVPHQAIALGGGGISTQPPVPVQSDKPGPKGVGVAALVTCRFSITAELATNHNLNDPNKANNKAARIVTVRMPPK